MGRPRTPVATLKARGTYREDRHGGTVQYPPGKPTCPAFLGKEAKAEWKRQVKQLEAVGLLADVDRAMLAAYCDAWGEFVEVSQAVNETVKESGYRAAIAAGLVNAKGKAAERMARLAQQFGFSPSSRSRVKAPEQVPSGEEEKPTLYKIRS